MILNTRKIKPYVLPAAIILGLIFHDACGMISGIVPYLIFAILILSFASTNLRKLKFKKLDLWLMLFQALASLALYISFQFLFHNEALAQGMMLAALCPVASSVTVVATMLGAKRENTIAYTIVGNLLICVLAPAIFVFIGNNPYSNLTDSFYAIFGKIATIIGLPFFIMLIIQIWAKPVNKIISNFSGLSFYLWAAALLLTLGQTIDFIFLHGKGHLHLIVGLGLGAAILCPLQFFIGRLIGKRFGDTIAGQQLLGQKNSAMGIWMANTYLNPLASTFLAFYSIWQNILNSRQIYLAEKN
ncbi:MAG: transporter [Prevotella sp.]|nr:transporter [Bacteroides sp.]MCM1366836.1 transporter [Prevotella sp.]MCM1437186.1 transporter [Prevotella sp.]